MLFDMSSEYVSIPSSNSPKVLVLCDMKSEKGFYYGLIWKELSRNVIIA